MPQISQLAETYSSQIFWVLLVFALIYVVVGMMMVPKVMSTVEERDAKISGDLDAARAARDAADQMEERYREEQNALREEARVRTAEAKDAATRDTEAKVAAADKDIEARIMAAEADLAARRGAAMAELEDVAAETAQDIVERLTGANVSKDEASGAVKGAMADG